MDRFKNIAMVSEIEDPTLCYQPLTRSDLNMYVQGLFGGNTDWLGFLQELMQKLPTCKFAIDSNQKSKVHVYLPSDLYAMGWVGFGDFRIAGDGTPTITVCSHNIANDKYASYQDQHNMLMSVSPKRALKNALGHLRPYTPFQIAKKLSSAVAHRVHASKKDSVSKVGSARSEVVHHKQFQAELRALVNSNYTFLDKEFGDLVHAFISEVDEYEMNSERVDMYYVRAYTLNGYEYFDLQSCEKMHCKWDYKVCNEPSERHTADTLPQNIAGKLAVLMMCAVDEYVDGVGCRVNDGVFYVNK